MNSWHLQQRGWTWSVIMLSERSQTREKQIYEFTHVKYKTNNKIIKQTNQIKTNTENRAVAIRGKRERGG